MVVELFYFPSWLCRNRFNCTTEINMLGLPIQLMNPITSTHTGFEFVCSFLYLRIMDTLVHVFFYLRKVFQSQTLLLNVFYSQMSNYISGTKKIPAHILLLLNSDHVSKIHLFLVKILPKRMKVQRIPLKLGSIFDKIAWRR